MASDKLPWFKFFPADWLSDVRVRAMTPEARGVYIDLLALCWREQTLPHNPATLARLVGVPAKAFEARLWPQLVPCFTWTEDGYVQKRLERERDEQAAYRAERSAAGTRGNLVRWHRTAIAEPSLSDNPAIAQRSQNIASQSTEEEEEKDLGGGGAGVQRYAPASPRPLHGRRNPDLMTHGPLKLWASQFRDEIVPLVATHHAGDRDAAYQPALAWVGQVDAENLTTKPSADDLAKPQRWWTLKAAERWGTDAPAADSVDAHNERSMRRALENHRRSLEKPRDTH